jgi:L-ascorbate metabolism protein UlaG (beta-lactamase superfamily)
MIALVLAALPLWAAGQTVKTDFSYSTSVGSVMIMPSGHGSLTILFGGRLIYVDPYSQAINDSKTLMGLADADLVLITHEHGDHYDKELLDQIVVGKRTYLPETYVITNPGVAALYDRENLVMANGDETEWNGMKIKAVPAYNIVHRNNGQPYHPKGVGNGYLLTFGDLTVYIAGDTEPIPEMRELKDIDVAFLPKNLPYTMSDAEFVEAAKIVNPKVLYPYHFSEIDRKALQKQLPGIELK